MEAEVSQGSWGHCASLWEVGGHNGRWEAWWEVKGSSARWSHGRREAIARGSRLGVLPVKVRQPKGYSMHSGIQKRQCIGLNINWNLNGIFKFVRICMNLISS